MPLPIELCFLVEWPELVPPLPSCEEFLCLSTTGVLPRELGGFTEEVFCFLYFTVGCLEKAETVFFSDSVDLCRLVAEPF